MVISTDIYGGIDGTGPTDNNEYAAEFQNSFVNKLFKSWPSPAKSYDRGPAWSGATTGERSETMAIRVAGNLKVMKSIQVSRGLPAPKIFLAGYSRGGAAVINTCHLLQKMGENVHCLLLFDAVDRTDTLDDKQTIVPANVTYCFHARRSPKAGSREVFGNCGSGKSGHAPSVQYTEKLFFCTHGAMGGVGWTKAGADGFIREEEVNVGASVGLSLLGSKGRLASQIYRGAVNSESEIAKTNVNLSMEKAGQANVDRWMSLNMQIARYQVNTKLDLQTAAARGHSAGNPAPN